MTALLSRHFQPTQLRGVNRDARTVDIVASDYSLDSYGTRIDPSGWDLEQFRKNPVICLQHDSYMDLPVASAIPETIRVENGKLLMTVQFPPEGTSEDADEAFGLIAAGVLRGVSVGFDPSEWQDTTERTPDGQELRVRVYTKQRLMETSFVTIPSNDNGLVVRARQLNADPAELKTITEKLESRMEAKPAEAQVLVRMSDWQKYEGYFARKQPANKVSAKVLERFFKKVIGEDTPADEVAAWTRMLDVIESSEEIVGEPATEPKIEEAPVETPAPDVTPEVKPEEPLPEPKSEEPKEESTLPPTTPVQEAPEPARAAPVQIPVSDLLSYPERMTKALTDAAVAALRQGVPVKDVGTLIDGLQRTVTTSFTHIRHGSHT